MPAITILFRSEWSDATFEGVVEPSGSSGYAFFGSLKARCRLGRLNAYTPYIVRFGHGGTSGDYTYLKFDLEDSKESTIRVEGKGTRAPNETVDFRLGVNEQGDDRFKDGDKITVTAGGPSQVIKPFYIAIDGNNNTTYDVRFDGIARADGPTGFVIEGTLSAYFMDGALTTQYARFGYKSSSGLWKYKTYGGDDADWSFKVSGTRKAGEKIQVVVGATSQVFNLYAYGNEVNIQLAELF